MTCLDVETVSIPLVVRVDELEKVSHGREHAFTDMVPAKQKGVAQLDVPLTVLMLCYQLGDAKCATYLGNLSASRSTTSMPSRARAEEA